MASADAERQPSLWLGLGLGLRLGLELGLEVEHSNLDKKVTIRFDSILATESIFFDSIRQSDKFAACTLIFK